MGLHLFFSFLRGLFYKKVPVPWGPSGTYYGSLVVINHGRVSIWTQCLPRVSNSHSLTVSSTVAFLSVCPLFSVAPTWTLRNWSFSCWCVFFVLFFLHYIEEEKKWCSLFRAGIKHGKDLKLTFAEVLSPLTFLSVVIWVVVRKAHYCHYAVWAALSAGQHMGFNCIHLSWVLTRSAQSQKLS